MTQPASTQPVKGPEYYIFNTTINNFSGKKTSGSTASSRNTPHPKTYYMTKPKPSSPTLKTGKNLSARKSNHSSVAKQRPLLRLKSTISNTSQTSAPAAEPASAEGPLPLKMEAILQLCDTPLDYYGEGSPVSNKEPSSNPSKTTCSSPSLKKLDRYNVGGESGSPCSRGSPLPLNRHRYSFNNSLMNRKRAYTMQVGLESAALNQSKVTVVARIRPLNKMEGELLESNAGDIVVQPLDSKSIYLPTERTSFIFDGVYHNVTQADFFESVAKVTVADVMQGYNGTIFAYGPTGTGKTFTMFGGNDSKTMGIIPRSAIEIFEFVRRDEAEIEYSIKCGMLEIYKEELRDLLVPHFAHPDLKIKESPLRGIYVDGLTEKSIASEDEFLEVIRQGSKSRAVAEMRNNQFSSRSHTIFLLQIAQKLPNGIEKKATLNLVDLAGCEKLSKSGEDLDERLKETKKINTSLLALGNVIHALTNGSEHIPYRDSKLTRILQESLGGNYKTTLIFTISPFSMYKDETLSSIKFAQRARNVKNRVHVNVKHSAEHFRKIIEELKAELYQTKVELQNAKVESRPKTVASERHEENSRGTPNLALDKIGESIQEMKALQLTNEVAELKATVKEQERTLAKYRGKLLKAKKANLGLEQKIKEYESCKLYKNLQNNIKDWKDESTKMQIESLNSQLATLTAALKESEEACKTLLEEKRGYFHDGDYRTDSPSAKFKEYRMGRTSQKAAEIIIDLDKVSKGGITPYSQRLKEAITDEKIPTETELNLLKRQLLDSGIYNNTLHTLLQGLEWKLKLEQKRRETTENYCALLEKCNQELNEVLDQSHGSHCSLRNRIEKLEENLDRNNEKLVALELDKRKESKVIKTFTRKSIASAEAVKDLPESCCIPLIQEEKKDTDEIIFLKTELNLQTARAEQLHKSFMIARDYIKELNTSIKEIEESSEKALSKEHESWQQTTKSLKENYEKELLNKQQEIIKLHEMLADWIMKYMDLEKKKKTFVTLPKSRNARANFSSGTGMILSARGEPLNNDSIDDVEEKGQVSVRVSPTKWPMSPKSQYQKRPKDMV